MASMQHMEPPPVEGRFRRGVLSLPGLKSDRIRTAKALVEKAVKLRRIFTVHGPYPVIRAALRARGWVERRLPRPAKPATCCHGDDEDDGDDGDDSNDDNDRVEEGEKVEDLDDMYAFMSRLVRNESTHFYWTTRRDSIDCRCLQKDQMINHYAKSGTFTTKVGLCVNMRNLQWFDTADPDTFFPRCYKLGAEDEKHAFIEDFRRTACSSLLQYVAERHGQTIKENAGVESEGQRSQHAGHRVLGPGMIDRALSVCQDYINDLEHGDIDVAMETNPSMTEQQWADFMQNYYLVVHEGAEIEGVSGYAETCQAMLTRLQQACPQLDTDGLHNIWIIKPGAKSRGRGIICLNRLEEILKLVDSDPALIKDTKWVVQKYLERPLLVHGTKFDMRQWFLVTDWNPLTIWFYGECYLRFSTQPYSTQTLDSSVHLCNNSIQKHFQPSQQRHPGVPEDNMWSCSEFRAFLRAQGRGAEWGDVVVPGMQWAIIHALQTAQDLVEGRRGSFELYGADFMLGRDLRPWLLEINASPTMATSTAATARLCPAVQLDTLRVVLDRRTDSSAHTGGFQLIYKQPAVEVPQYVGMNLLVEGAPLRRARTTPLHKTSVAPVPHLRTQLPLNQSASGEAGRVVQPSNHKLSTASSRQPSGKENQSGGVKKPAKRESQRRVLEFQRASAPSSCPRLATERPLLTHTEPQRRTRHLGMSLSCGGPLRLVPKTLSCSFSPPSLRMSDSQSRPGPTRGLRTSRPFLPQMGQGAPRRAPPRDLPSLFGPISALKVFRLQPGPLPWYPVLRMHQAPPQYRTQAEATEAQGTGEPKRGEH
ncbi:tubulin monoglycylase TTLL3 [Aplochiton taeniatus]